MMKKNKGFTLIELLVVISIMGVLMAISIFALKGAREAGRNSKRKADIESIRSGLEMYRADCGNYPASLGTSLTGINSTGNVCLISDVYIQNVPVDPLTSEAYGYSSDGVVYQITATLEPDEVYVVTNP